MTVKELIEKLKGMPEDARVFTHSCEDDDYANEVKCFTRENFVDPEEDYPYFKDYYCQGDCIAAMHLNEHANEENVVVIF